MMKNVGRKEEVKERKLKRNEIGMKEKQAKKCELKKESNNGKVNERTNEQRIKMIEK